MAPLVALVVVGDLAATAGPDGEVTAGPLPRIIEEVRRLEETLQPRWAVPAATVSLKPLVDTGIRVRRCWDVAEVHRLIAGGWPAGLDRAWATTHDLDPDHLPQHHGDLFDLLTASAAEGEADDRDGPDDPVRPDGFLRPDVLDPRWASTAERLGRVAAVVLETARRQRPALLGIGPRTEATAHSESAAAALCVELEADGLPVNRVVATRLIAASAGERPADDAAAARIRAERDRAVLVHAPGREQTDLRNPVQVRDLLASVGIVVPTTRANVLEPFRATHPLVDALLRWRKDERIATTYGYRWLDEHVGPDERLRGGWTSTDGAAGRMTAQNGLHNLPAPLRPAVVAEPGHVFVRADLGQIEPRVLAVVSGDRAFAEATRADDLYAPVAATLGVDRPVAKVAVLSAMYGGRAGAASRALVGLQRAYPVAMRYLDEAYASGVARRPLRTFGGRRLGLDTVLGGGDDGARGRFARNAVIQGSAAELFKAWAATVRHELAGGPTRIVLCLHDELLLQAPRDDADRTADLVLRTLRDSARRWSGSDQVRFVADVSVVDRWSDAKG